MSQRPASPIARMVFAFAVLGISFYCAVTAYAAVIAAGGNDHQSGDWLISYPGEFVRRGLFGELLLRTAAPGPATLWALFVLQVALYLPLFAFAIEYLFRARFSWSAIALVCSPGALAFIGWDPLGAFRKETLGFVALVLLATARRSVSASLRALLLGSSLLVWTIGVFSWEALAFLLPAVIFLLRIDKRLPLRRVLSGGYILIGLAALSFSVLAHGNAQTSDRLCAAVTDHGLGPNLCTGAITWMGRSLADSLRLVDQNLAVHSGYLFMLVLALLPVALSPWLRHYWPWALGIAVGIAPLFLLGIDYGRWVHILMIELMIVIMASRIELIESPLWNPLSAALFTTLWGIPHAAPTPADLVGWPFKGLLATVIGWVQGVLLQLR